VCVDLRAAIQDQSSSLNSLADTLSRLFLSLCHLFLLPPLCLSCLFSLQALPGISYSVQQKRGFTSAYAFLHIFS